ncbi:ring-cleaving dioxygenase [Salinisphaera sp.]|uniref:ring-cleaving dioxygenase n=1 Tax=Salinisphaera sp. TaxID=1914330 RepID=UPI002D76E417|nr:ring-cleaving dioxygenase [Salinisphaera sp.]HET7314033.1 ring-cleaving dioxygenase [Salinisphaera sp.]
MSPIQVGGLHHVTAIAADAQRNVDFYTGVLGLRFVKKTVNQDDPFTYHLYYGDTLGRPGTAMTFFPFPDLPAGQPGQRQVYETAFSVPAASLGHWRDRLERHDITALSEEERFGAPILRFADPDGLIVVLVGDAADASEAGWPEGPVPVAEAVRAFSSVRLASAATEATARVLTELLGYTEAGEQSGTTRFAIADAERAGAIDLMATPPPGRRGAGTVHHVAFRVPDRDTLTAMRQQLVDGGMQPTPEIDRFYFRSVYFREPGGILFEIATDEPGFAVDEDIAALGSELKLTAEHEPQRARIEAQLPPIHV